MHAVENRVVDVDAFGTNIHDLARLESTVGSRDGMENA
jgi:hypothetical protein